MPDPISEQEEFEFRLRSEQEGNKDSSPGFVGPTISQVTETSPISLQNSATRIGDPGLGEPEVPLTDEGQIGRVYSPQERKNAEAGVNIYKGLPSSLRWQLPFLDDVNKVNAIQKSGKPVRRVDGQIQWWDSTTRRWTPTDSANIESADFGADLAGAALPTTLSALMSAGAMATSKSPALQVTAAAVGTGMGEFLNQKIGQAIGLEAEVDPNTKALKAGGEAAGIDALFGVGAMSVSGLYKVYRRLFYPGGLADEAPKILDKFTPDKVELVNDISNLAKRQFRPTVGQMTGDEFLLQLQQNASKNVDLSVQFGERMGESRSVLEDALTNLNEFRVTHAGDYERADAIRAAIKKDLDQQLTAGQTADETLKRKLSEQVTSIVPEGDSGLIGRKAMEAAQAPNAALKKEVEDAYDKSRRMTRYDPETGRSAIPPLRPDKELKDYWSSLNRASKETILGGLEPYSKLRKGRIEDILSGKIGVQKTGKASDEYLDIRVPTMPDGTPIGNVAGKYPGPITDRPYGVYNSGGPYDTSVTRTQLPGTEEYQMPGIDINQLNEDLKFYRGKERAKEIGVEQKKLNDHIKQLEAFRARSLQDRPEVLQAIEYAEGLRLRQAKEFDDTVISSMFAADAEGNYQIADKEAFALIFEKPANKGGDRAFTQFMNIVKGDKSAVQASKEAFQSLYNAAVIDPDTLLPKSKAAHREFMREYEDRMKQVFPPRELEKIKEVGGFDAVVQKSAKNLEKLNSDLDASTLGKLGNIRNPEAIVKTLLASGKESLNLIDVQNTVDVASKHGLTEDLRKSTAQWIVDKITKSNPKSPFSFAGFDTVLDNYSAKLETIMGPQYMSNLRKIRDGLEMSTTKSELPPPKDTDAGTVFNFMRSLIIAPFSREGRAMTQIRAGKKNRASQTVADVILDHTGESLKKMVQLERGSMNKAAALRFLATVGGAGIAAEEAQSPGIQERLQEYLGEEE